MKHQHNIVEALFLSPKDRKAAVFLVLIALILGILMAILMSTNTHIVDNEERFATLINQKINEHALNSTKSSLVIEDKSPSKYQSKNHSSTASKGLEYAIDPNNASYDELRAFGLSNFAANNLLGFRKDRIAFYSIEDLFKIYGIDTSLLKANQELLRFPQKNKSPQAEPMSSQKDSSSIIVAETVNTHVEVPQIFDLNEVTSEELQSIKGIGPSYAKQIIKRRNELGGYHHIEQLQDVWNFPLATYEAVKERFTISRPIIKKIKLINPNFDSILRHPYTDYEVTKLLMNIHPLRIERTVDSLYQAGIISDDLYIYLK